LQYEHPRSIKRVIRSDKPITSVFPVKSQKCDFGAEPRCRLFATSAGKVLNPSRQSGNELKQNTTTRGTIGASNLDKLNVFFATKNTLGDLSTKLEIRPITVLAHPVY
jgi:hypothetical protein